jgi:vacuolar-type H+-ATPase subunit E/Vma4
MDEKDNNVIAYRVEKLEKEVEEIKSQGLSNTMALIRVEGKQDEILRTQSGMQKTMENMGEAIKTLSEKPQKEFNAVKVSVIGGLILTFIVGSVTLALKVL